AGDKQVEVRGATADEIAADPVASSVVSGLPDGRWIAFRPVVPFAPDTSLDIEVGPGTPSAEGPLTTTSAASYSGSTYAPLAVEDSSCAYDNVCTPGSSFEITMNNELDALKFDPASVVIDPPIPGVSIGTSGNVIDIYGPTEPHTAYTVTLPAALTDVYGQQLGSDQAEHFPVGAATPMLQQFPQPLTTLDPLASGKAVSVVTVNHTDFRVRTFQVAPADWAGYLRYFVGTVQSGRPDSPLDPPWKTLSDEKLAVDGDPDHIIATAVDLSGVLPGHGSVVVLVEPTEHYTVDSPDYWANRPTITWVQSTTVGVDASNDASQLHAWATDLRDGTPLAGATITLLGDKNPSDDTADDSVSTAPVTTGDDGQAVVALSAQPSDVLVATQGDDTAILPANLYGGSWQKADVLDDARWYVFDDRAIYRPSETVSIKGWVRRLTSSSDSQLQLIDAGATVNFTVTDAQGNQIGTGSADVGPLGGFDFTVAIPADAALGYANVQIDLQGVSGLSYGSDQHTFQIEEFRRPEFEVDARDESPGPYLQGTPLTLAVDANYYSGGALGAAPVDWTVTTADASYSPPGWDDFDFGVWTPWWFADDFSSGYSGRFPGDYGPTVDGPCCFGGPGTDSNTKQFSGTTDGAGTDYLQVDAGSLDDDHAGLPVTVTAQASVTDVNRQALASTTSVLVHPADLYVGLRGKNTFVRRGDPLVIDSIATGIDGAAVAGAAIHVTASRSESVFTAGQYVDTPVDTQTCDVTSTTDPVSCTFTTATGGTYTIKATVTDDAGRTSRTELTRWVSGADAAPTRIVQQESLTLVPDKQTYAPGDTAQLLVQSPFAAGTGQLTITRNNHIVSTTTFAVADSSAIVSIPVADTDIPGIGVSIEVVGTAPRADDSGTVLPDAPQRPAFATGEISLDVSTATRALTVTAVPDKDTLEPGGDSKVAVTVQDNDGQPVEGSELAVVVVDEAVLALSDYTLADPLSAFYTQLPSYISEQYGRSSIVLADPTTVQNQSNGTADTTAATTAEAQPALSAGTPETTVPSSDTFDTASGGKSVNPAADGDATGANGGAIDVRTNFDALAVFEPSVLTDADGHASIDVPLPDNLTRYRVMVVAVAGADTFGSAEANITARLPLQVRPSAPRFLNFGDTFELPVVVQNQTDAPMDVDVVLQTDNLTLPDSSGTAGTGQRVTVPANDRVEVRFPVSAALAGTARFRVAATSGDASDAATIELPVYTPSTAEAFATYGVIDDGATNQPVATPTDVIPEFGALDVTTSSTSLQALTDAVLYISQYPYDSSDARASRILAISSLRDVLAAFDAPDLPTPEVLNQTVQDDIDALVPMQDGDGGFPYWSGDPASDPFNTIEVLHALLVARADGFTVPQFVVDVGLLYLADIESHISADYSQDARDSLSAYALDVRMIGGDRDAETAKTLFDSRNDLPLDAIAWLWPVVDDTTTSKAIETIIDNRAVDTAGAVTFTTSVADDDYVTLRSDRRTDGLILDALIAVRPTSDMIPKVVAGLLAAQDQNGRWDNIQENSFILLAMKHYFDAFESQTPDFVARVWLGDRFAGDHSFVGRSTDRVRFSIPTADLLAADPTATGAGLVIQKDGTGRLYYRIGLRTAPTDLQLDPLDRGFTVVRTYEAVDDPADVSRDADGTWHIKAGARVRVRLTMVAESQRTHVALIDPLPAGLEILNPDLATTADVPTTVPTDQGNGDVIVGSARPTDIPEYGPWYGTWFDHENLRDDRAEAFSTYLGAGVYDYSYVASATTPGTFVVPPTRAEEMYSPETFGRAGTDKVVIGD
ncbi:MAG: hypothetical protein JWN39_2879, partial [Ilumatobacteraceae bacterium]|nr:hypothetical protein [Ilumatobacteraceae bacterium]